MIVPADKDANNKITYHLPMGIMSKAFTDKTTGSLTEHTGKLVIGVSDVKGFLLLPNRFELMVQVLAAASSFDANFFHVFGISAAGRRLTEFDTNFRRMAAHGGKLNVDYKVSIPDTYTGAKFSAKSIDSDKIKTNLVKHAQAAGLAITVDSVDVKPVTTETVTGETTVTGGASPMAGVSSLIAAAMFLAGQQLL